MLLLIVGALVWSGTSEAVFRADVAVVPGNTIDPDGHPSPRLAARLDRALALYRDGLCARIIVSGGIGQEGFDEAAVMRRYLIERGVPDALVIADSQGVTTRDTARFTAAYLKEHHLSSALAVSQYFHVPRLRLALHQAGILVTGQASARFFELRDVYSILREVPALFAYGIKGRNLL